MWRKGSTWYTGRVWCTEVANDTASLLARFYAPTEHTSGVLADIACAQLNARDPEDYDTLTR